MFVQLPMYQRVGGQAYKANLDNIEAIALHLGNPERAFKSVHIAGTNGKGSTSHMLASVLQEAGYKVGLYTSPHLKDFRERIKINGEMIPKRSVSSFIDRHKDFFTQQKCSFFEMTVGMAFYYFRRKEVDIAIIEVGLGGRLDSTNIIIPEVAAITNIGLDHTQFLGTTLEEIAAEKAGIIKPGVPVVIGETTPETKQVFSRIAKEHGAPIFFSEERDWPSYHSDLKGEYQKVNKRLVLSILEQLKQKSWVVSAVHIKNGLENVVPNTGLLGRWQILQERPLVVCDTAHNKEGLQWVIPQLLSLPFHQLHIVLGMVSDKDLQEILPLFPKEAIYYFCKPNVARGLEVETLQRQALEFRLQGRAYPSVEQALMAAKKAASDTDVVFVGGSTFVVAEVL